MPVLQRNRDGSGYTLRDVDDDLAVVYDLRPEGAQILLNVYGVKVGGAVDAETLERLIGLRLAAPRPAEPPTEPEPPAARRAPPPRSRPPPEPRPHPLRHQRRTRGREIALQVLYQLEQNPGQPPRTRSPGSSAGGSGAQALRLRPRPWSAGVLRTPAADRRPDLGGRRELAARPDGRHRPQHPPARRLRVALRDDVPTKVAINEALELAKRYSTAQSSRFVNGILDRLQTGGAGGARLEEGRTGRGEPSPSPRPSPAPEAESASDDEPGTNALSRSRRRPIRPDPSPAPRPTSTSTPPIPTAAARPARSSGPRPTSGSRRLAITDHDTLSAIAVARPEADRLGVELIAGRRADGRARRPGDPHPRPLRPRRRPGPRRRLRPTSATPGPRGSRRWPSGSGTLGLSVDLDALRGDVPAGHARPQAPGRLARQDRPGRRPSRGVRPLSSATTARRTSPSRGSPGARPSP